MRRLACAWLAPLALLLATSSGSAQLPEVDVSFTLAEPSYADEYTDAEIRDIQRQAAELVAGQLAHSVAFLRLGAFPTSPYHLVVRLLRRQPGTTGPAEVGLWASLAGAGVDSASIYWLTLRPIEAYNDARGTPRELLADLRARVQAPGAGAAVQELLGRVPIAAKAAVWSSPLGWVLPFRRAELCLDPASTLRIRNRIQSGAGPRVLELVADASGDFDPTPLPAQWAAEQYHVVGYALPGQAGLDDLKSAAAAANGVVVEGVYVRDYHRSATSCGTPTPPDSAFPTEGGHP